MDELAQALAKLREAGALLDGLADYVVAERMLPATDPVRIALQVVATLTEVCELNKDAATLIVEHLQSID